MRASRSSPSVVRRRALAALAVVAFVAGGPASATLAPPDPSGASVSGYAWGTFWIGCTTCSALPIALTGDPSPQAGGPGSTSASFSYTGAPDRTASEAANPNFAFYTLGGGVTMSAQASFDGSALRLPLLGALASADNVQAFIVGTDPPNFAGIDTYGANATAQTRMRYTWMGAAPATLTFNFELHGTVEDQRSSVYGSAAFYDDTFEVPLSTPGSALLAGEFGYGDVASSQSRSFSVALNFTPGRTAVLQATLSAGVFAEYASGTTFADAMHTLRVTSLTGGDLSLLSVSPVPEPATAASLLAGLALLGAALRRRR